MQTYGKRKKKLVVSAVEHASVRNTMQFLQDSGYEVVTIAPDATGIYHASDFLDAIDSNTCLLSMMMVNNETGYRLPVQTVFRAAKRKFPELITHCDAVQGFLKVPFQVRSLQADLLSISGHKVHGVKGVGALYQKNGIICIRHSMAVHRNGDCVREQKMFRQLLHLVQLYKLMAARFGNAIKQLLRKKHIYWNDYRNFQTVKFIL